MSRIDAHGWTGDAANAFRDAYSTHPQKWSEAGAGCSSAQNALTTYSSTLTWAQGRASEAIALYDEAKAASKAAADAYNSSVDSYNTAAVAYNASGGKGVKPTMPGAFVDPGVEMVKQAQAMLDSAREQRNSAASQAASAITAATQAAPEKPSFTSRMGSDVKDGMNVMNTVDNHIRGGILTGTGDIVKTVRALNPTDTYNMTHPAEYTATVTAAAAGIVHDANHPVDALKQMAGAGWGKDPGEAFGKIIPQVALGLGTGGAGGAAEGAAMNAVERSALSSVERSALSAGGRSAVGEGVESTAAAVAKAPSGGGVVPKIDHGPTPSAPAVDKPTPVESAPRPEPQTQSAGHTAAPQPPKNTGSLNMSPGDSAPPVESGHGTAVNEQPTSAHTPSVDGGSPHSVPEGQGGGAPAEAHAPTAPQSHGPVVDSPAATEHSVPEHVDGPAEPHAPAAEHASHTAGGEPVAETPHSGSSLNIPPDKFTHPGDSVPGGHDVPSEGTAGPHRLEPDAPPPHDGGSAHDGHDGGDTHHDSDHDGHGDHQPADDSHYDGHDPRAHETEPLSGEQLDILERHGLTVDDLHHLTPEHVSALSPAHQDALHELRRSYPEVTEDTQLQKVLPEEAGEKLLNNDVNEEAGHSTDGMGGSIAVFDHVRNLDNTSTIIEGLGLKYDQTPFVDDRPMYAVRFHMRNADTIDIPDGPLSKLLGDDRGFDPGYDMPFTGSGYTNSSHHIVPEYWAMKNSQMTPGAEMWRIEPDGTQTKVGTLGQDGSWSREGA